MNTNPTLERIARAIAKSAGSGVIADLSVEGEPFTAVLLDGCFDLNEFASAVLQALKSLDDAVVEAMADQITTDYPGLVKAECRAAFTAAIDHILGEDHDAK